MLFTHGYYSMTWSLRRSERPTSATLWHPTDEEKTDQVAGFVVNAGAYEIGDSLLTVHPIVAKTPEYMGGRGVFRYTLSGDTLLLTGVQYTSASGVVDSGATTTRVTRTLIRAPARGTNEEVAIDSLRPDPIVWWELAAANQEESVEFFRNVFNWPLEYNERLQFYVGAIPSTRNQTLWGGIFTMQQARVPFLTLYIACRTWTRRRGRLPRRAATSWMNRSTSPPRRACASSTTPREPHGRSSGHRSRKRARSRRRGPEGDCSIGALFVCAAEERAVRPRP